MMMLVAVTVVLSGVLIIPGLIRRGWQREAVISGLLLVASLVLSLLIFFHLQLPYLSPLISALIGKITGR
jgi:hypothetical protein